MPTAATRRRRPPTPPTRPAARGCRAGRARRAARTTVTTSAVDDERPRRRPGGRPGAGRPGGPRRSRPGRRGRCRPRARATSPLTAPPMTATMAITTIATLGVEQDRQEHRDRRGRQEERQRRPAGGDLERERRADEQQRRSARRTLLRCQSVGPEAPDPGQQHRRRAGPRAASQPAKLGDVGRGLAQAERVDLLDVGVGRAGRPSRTMTSPWRICTPTASTASAAGRRAWSVSSGLNDEFGDEERADQLGGEHPLGLVEAAGHPPGQAGPRPRRPRCRGAPSRSVASRTRAASVADGRPARRVEPDERRRGRRRTGPASAVSSSDARSSGVRSAAKAVSIAADASLEARAAARRRSRSRSRW